jgi:hypothetical protein
MIWINDPSFVSPTPNLQCRRHSGSGDTENPIVAVSSEIRNLGSA